MRHLISLNYLFAYRTYVSYNRDVSLCNISIAGGLLDRDREDIFDNIMNKN
ncbi:hypothetical protein EGLA_19100 [Enterococcus gallinarum]|nr:hypothetical protein AH4_12090 [Enterococcus gallinarum]